MEIIKKIKMFFKAIFGKKIDKLDEPKNQEVNTNNNFKNDIIIEKDKEQERLLQIQEDFRNGIIREEEISVEDKEKLYLLYDKQILELKEKIKQNRQLTEKYKLEIINLKKSK